MVQLDFHPNTPRKSFDGRKFHILNVSKGTNKSHGSPQPPTNILRRNPTMKKLKVNLHITQYCNYHCRYCFAQFREKQNLPLEDWERIIDNLDASGIVDSVNFAGGEPVLYPGFGALVDYAFQKGFRLSVISNGSLLMKKELVPPGLFSKLEMLGISVDSVNPSTLRALGCCDPQGRVLDEESLCRLIWTAKGENPKLRIKLNTVVTKLNKGEQLSEFGAALPIERWKFLKMKLFEEGTFSNRNLQISDEEFDRFLGIVNSFV